MRFYRRLDAARPQKARTLDAVRTHPHLPQPTVGAVVFQKTFVSAVAIVRPYMS